MFQKLKSRLKINRGSILVFTLIVLFIILATAIGIASVTVIERKTAGTTGKSTAGFQVADSGAEVILQKIYKGDYSTMEELTGETGDCSTMSGEISPGKTYTVTFKDVDDNPITDCSKSISEIDKIKSVGTYAGTTRAIEVAVAATYENGNNCNALEISAEKNSANLADAVKGCRDSGSGWYLPTAEELSCFIGLSGVSSSLLWTRTPNYSNSDSWVVIKLTNGCWNSSNGCSGSIQAFRCVR